jgi:hypothetical protein
MSATISNSLSLGRRYSVTRSSFVAPTTGPDRAARGGREVVIKTGIGWDRRVCDDRRSLLTSTDAAEVCRAREIARQQNAPVGSALMPFNFAVRSAKSLAPLVNKALNFATNTSLSPATGVPRRPRPGAV